VIDGIDQKGRIMDRQDIDLRHALAALELGVKLHCVTAGTGDRTIVLLHGFQNMAEVAARDPSA
jgi:hypothetical protein